jgi:hypothetical protein
MFFVSINIIHALTAFNDVPEMSSLINVIFARKKIGSQNQLPLIFVFIFKKDSTDTGNDVMLTQNPEEIRNPKDRALL